jgi:hypothetical protein
VALQCLVGELMDFAVSCSIELWRHPKISSKPQANRLIWQTMVRFDTVFQEILLSSIKVNIKEII